MIIHLYTMSWNEAPVLGFFFRHYDPWVARYVFYDDGSDDGTIDVLRRHPRVEVRRFERRFKRSFVLSQRLLQNEMWQESRGKADWVIITAVDEHLHHPDFDAYLERSREAGVTMIPALGFQMLATEFPRPDDHLATTHRRGAPFIDMCKLSIFDPQAIERTRFGNGRHTAAPTGRIALPESDELLNLHYKYLGIDYIRKRHALLKTGLGSFDRLRGWSTRYEWSDAPLKAEIASFQEQAVDIADPQARRNYPCLLWWRPPDGRVRYSDHSSRSSSGRDASSDPSSTGTR